MKLTVTDVRVAYGHGSRAVAAVDGADIEISTGQSVGLVGESGSGKSTLAKAIVGLARMSSGSVLLDGADFSAEKTRRSRVYRRNVQMVFQDSYSSLNPRMRLSEVLMEPLRYRNKEMTSAARFDEARRLLEIVGIPSRLVSAFPHELSGGQRQRVSIARALAVGAQLLINDEITSALDVSVQATILNLLQDLQSSMGLGFILISHDLSVVRAICDRVCVMYLGRIVESGPADAIFSAPRHPYTRSLISCVPRLLGDRAGAHVPLDAPDSHRPPGGCCFRERCPVGPKYRSDRQICVDVDPVSEHAVDGYSVACHFA